MKTKAEKLKNLKMQQTATFHNKLQAELQKILSIYQKKEDSTLLKRSLHLTLSQNLNSIQKFYLLNKFKREQDINFNSRFIKNKNFSLDLDTGKISYTPKMYSIFFIRYILITIRDLVLLLKKDKSVKNNQNPYEVSYNFDKLGNLNTPMDFVNYFNKLTDRDFINTNLIIQSGLEQKLQSSFFSKRPFLQIIKRQPLLFRLQFFIWTIFSFSTLFRKCFKNPSLLSIYKDFIDYNMVSFLEKRNLLKNIYISNSYIFDLPFFLHKGFSTNYKSHFIWYSINSTGHIYLQQPEGIKFVDHFCLKFLSYDKGYYWSSGHYNWAKNFVGEHSSKVLSEISFCSKDTETFSLDSEPLKVIIFDISPLSQETEEEYGMVYNYYNLETLQNYIDKSIKVLKKLKVDFPQLKVEIKPKRIYSDIRSDQYGKNLKNLVEKNKDFIKVIAHDLNAIKLCEKASATISIPFTSTALLSNKSKSRSIYFDPTGEVIFQPELFDNRVLMTNNEDNLESFLRQAFNSSLN